MRLLMVQYADDYRQAFQRFEGGNETYYAQKYSIDTVAKIRKKIEEATFLLQVPVKWSDAIVRWLYDSPENQQWLFDHRLSSRRYICA